MSDENNNQTVGEETVPHTTAKSSGGVFSWLTGSRSPTYGTTTSASAGDMTTTTATSTGSRSGSVSPAGTASPASGTRSPARSSSPPRSPSRFVIPNIAAGFGGGGGGRFGPAVMMDMGARTVYTHTTEEPTTTTTTTTSSTMEDEQQQHESELPPSVVITTKTLGEPQLKTVKSVTSTTSSSDNQLMEPVLGANVQYVTKTETSAGEPHRVVRYTTTSSTGGTPVASPMGASSSNVRYVTSSTSGAVPVDGQEHHHHDGGVRYITRTVNNTTHTPVASPVAMAGGATSVRYVTTSNATPTMTVVDGEGHNESGSGVRYVTRTVTGSGSNAGSTSHTPVASPVAIGAGATSVRYVTTVGASPIGASGMHGGAATNVRFFPPQVQPPQVHTVTRVVNGQQVQVPMPVGGEPHHHHNVQYITRSASPAMSTHSSVSSSSGSMLASPVGAVEQRQQVRYITKTMGHAAAAPLSGQGQRQVQQSSTTTQAVGGSGLGGGAVEGNGAVMTSMTGSTSVSGGVPLRTVVASTLLNQDPNHTGVELAEEVEGLPVHFIGIQRTVTDTDSSDGEEHEVKMVFDIMSQTFKPAGKRRSRRSTAAAAAAGAGAGAAASAAIGAAAEGGAAGAAGASGTSGEAAGAAGAGGAAAGAAGAGAMAASGSIGGAAVAAEAEAYAEANAEPNAEANAGAGAYAGAGAIAAAGAAVAALAEADAELEGKAAVAAGAVEADADANGKKNGSGLAAAAAVGLAATVGVGAAVAVNAAGKTPSSPMMKLDTVAPAGPADALASTPGGPKKRTPSQSKAEPSPRQFFSEVPSTTASAAANKEQILLDETVTMDIDPQTQYAELRSPSHNGGARLNHVGLLLKVRKCRWLLITLISLAIIVFLTAIFYKGVTLKKFQSSRYSLSRQYDMADNYNSYLALFTALFGKPIEMLVAIVLPILFITIVDKTLLATKLSSCLMITLFMIGFLVSYLLCSAFHGINVQLRVQSATPIISLADMSLSLAGAASYAASGASALLIAAAAANASSNASVVVSETGAKNAITNTVLRNVVDLTVEPSTASPLCSNTVDYSNVLGANVPNLLSSVWTTTTTTYGFPMRSWQQEMLPGAVSESNYTLKLSDTTTTTLLNGVVLPMRLRTAANLFLHGVHVARDAFRWFGATSTPLGVQAAVDTKYGSATDGKLTHVFVSDLLGLTNTSTSNNVVDDVVSTPAFLNQVRSLFNRSLTGAANISRVESSLEFTSVSLPNGYAFESVTMEIPLVASFLSRRLTLSGNTFVEDTPDANETDIYYDLDIATDCGPYSGACEVRRTEYDASGNVFEPVTTVRALSLCNNSVGTDDLEVFFDGSVAKKNIAYTCDGQVDSGMLVVSVSSRIVGDALIEGPSTLLPRLVEGQATLKNARKIYSLTVGKLSWPKTNLATTFHAACAAGVGKCNGLQYALTAALKNSTVSVTTSGSLRGSVTTTEEDSGDNQYLVVGNDYLPLNQLSAFNYNTTEAATQTAKTTQAVSGFPLVTITKPVEADSLFENDGDVVVAANFKTVSWTQARRGASCSATVESRLNSVLNNHQYIERGVQPAYTAGMFFLFQDAVAKAQVALSLSGGASVTTLQFANTIEFVALVASIPLLSAVLTFIGCAIILLVSIYVLLMSRPKLYAIDSNGHEGDEEGTSGHVAQETLARVKLNQLLFPPVVLHRHIVDLTNSSHSTTTGTTALSPGGSKTPQSSGGYASLEGEEVDSFEVKGMQMEHENRDVSVDMAK